MAVLIKIILVCTGIIIAASYSVSIGSYWPLVFVGIGLYGYLFSELFLLSSLKKAGE